MADEPLVADTQPATSILPSELAPDPGADRLPDRVQGLRFAGPLEQEFQAFAQASQAGVRQQAVRRWLPVLLALVGASAALAVMDPQAFGSPLAWVSLFALGVLTVLLPVGKSLATRLKVALVLSVQGAVIQLWWWHGTSWPQHLLALAFLLAVLALAVLAAVQHDKALRALFLMQQTVTQMASTDALTGLGNRRAFEPFVARTLQHAARGQQRVALLLVDADHFRAYNEQRGHAAGDAAIKALARAVSMRIRRQFDLGARLGNEEFAMFFYDVNLGFAWTVAEELRRDVAQRLAMAHAGSPAGVLTVSVGAAVSSPGENFEQLYLRAASALSDAKAKGGNQVQLSE